MSYFSTQLPFSKEGNKPHSTLLFLNHHLQMLLNKARKKHLLNKAEPPFNVPQLSSSFTYIKQH